MQKSKSFDDVSVSDYTAIVAERVRSLGRRPWPRFQRGLSFFPVFAGPILHNSKEDGEKKMDELKDNPGNPSSDPQGSESDQPAVDPKPESSESPEPRVILLCDLLPMKDIEEMVERAMRQAMELYPPIEIAKKMTVQLGYVTSHEIVQRYPEELKRVQEFYRNPKNEPIIAKRKGKMARRFENWIDGLLGSSDNFYTTYAWLCVRNIVTSMCETIEVAEQGKGRSLVSGTWKRLRSMYRQYRTKEDFHAMELGCSKIAMLETIGAYIGRLLTVTGRLRATLEFLCQMRDDPKENFLLEDAILKMSRGQEKETRQYLGTIGVPKTIRDDFDTLPGFFLVVKDPNVDLANSNKPASKVKDQIEYQAGVAYEENHEALEGMRGKCYLAPSEWRKNISGSDVLGSLDEPGSSESDESGIQRRVSRAFPLLTTKRRLNMEKLAQKIRDLGGDAHDRQYVIALIQEQVPPREMGAHLGWSSEKVKKHQRFYYGIYPILAQCKEIAELIRVPFHGLGSDAWRTTEERYVSDHTPPVTSFCGLNEDADLEKKSTRTGPLDEMKRIIAKERKEQKLFRSWIPPED